MEVLSRLPSGWPALVLNADYRPLSYYPLSLWPWQETVKAVFLDRVDVLRRRPTGWRDGFAESEQLATDGGRTRLAAAQATDVADWLPHDLLLKLDRCLMAHAVEGRTPFLDPGVAAAAFRLPDELKLRGRMGKYLLRRWLEKHLPVAAPFSRKRGGSNAITLATECGNRDRRSGRRLAKQPRRLPCGERSRGGIDRYRKRSLGSV